jgi:hypothetical protein
MINGDLLEDKFTETNRKLSGIIFIPLANSNDIYLPHKIILSFLKLAVWELLMVTAVKYQLISYYVLSEPIRLFMISVFFLAVSVDDDVVGVTGTSSLSK